MQARLLGCYNLEQHFQVLDFRKEFCPESVMPVLFANFAADPGNALLVRDFTIIENMQIAKARLGMSGWLSHATEPCCPAGAVFCDHTLQCNPVSQRDHLQFILDLPFHRFHFWSASSCHWLNEFDDQGMVFFIIILNINFS